MTADSCTVYPIRKQTTARDARKTIQPWTQGGVASNKNKTAPNCWTSAGHYGHILEQTSSSSFRDLVTFSFKFIVLPDNLALLYGRRATPPPLSTSSIYSHTVCSLHLFFFPCPFPFILNYSIFFCTSSMRAWPKECCRAYTEWHTHTLGYIGGARFVCTYQCECCACRECGSGAGYFALEFLASKTTLLDLGFFFICFSILYMNI